MKNITKTAVATLVASSILLTSFAATADVEPEKKTVTPTEQVSSKKSDDTEPKESTQSSTEKDVEAEISVNTKESSEEKSKDTKADKEVTDEEGSSFCFGDCDDESHKSHNCDDEDESCETVHRFFHNRRDGFDIDFSAISSAGDDYSLSSDESSQSEFNGAISYRVQLIGLFMESPGITTRRIQGMYSLPSWGVNFYNSEDYSFDLFYQYSTRGIEGLEGIQSRNEDERGGLRMTGFYENSQFQMIYSPVSKNKEGSDGIEASISYSYNWHFRNWNYYANLGLQYRSQEVTPYGQETYLEDDLSFSDGINYSAEIGAEYPLTTHWVIGGFVGYNGLDERSIIARDDGIEEGYRAGLLLTLVF